MNRSATRMNNVRFRRIGNPFIEVPMSIGIGVFLYAGLVGIGHEVVPLSNLMSKGEPHAIRVVSARIECESSALSGVQLVAGLRLLGAGIPRHESVAF